MGSRDRYKELLPCSTTHSIQDTEHLSQLVDFFRKQHDHTAAGTYAEFATYIPLLSVDVRYSWPPPGMREAYVTAQQSFK